MKPSELKRIINRIQQTLQALEEHGPTAIHFHAGNRPGYPTNNGNEPVSGGTITSPTEQAALNPQPNQKRLQDGIHILQQLTWRCTELDQWIAEALPLPDDIQEEKRGRQNTASICAELHCEELAVKAGRCPPCYMYNRRHKGAPVPQEVIDARQAKRCTSDT